jgi:hypothetical protein
MGRIIPTNILLQERRENPRIELPIGIVTGNPGVIQGYPYLYPPKTHTRTEGTGFRRYR